MVINPSSTIFQRMKVSSFNKKSQRAIIEEGTMSLVEEGVKRKAIAEPSEGSSNLSPLAKRQKTENNGPSSKFKGVVPQTNGHWGAQIYANHRRFWLGTFKSETEAAMAYDSASIKLRTQDYHRNFPWTNTTIHEPSFQTAHSTKAVLNMIRDGTYPSIFADFLRGQRGEREVGNDLMKVHGHVGLSTTLLFQKELTPSDVGKLNRLVIPKQYAVLYFPSVSENNEENTNGEKLDDLQLVFYDGQMKLWEFRYCYWKSSQSFVFTRGWNRFVKEKGLVANDTVAFYSCKFQDKEKEQQTFLLIDVISTAASRNPRKVEEYEKNVCVQDDLCLRLGLGSNCGRDAEEKEVLRGQKTIEGLVTTNEKKSFRLFGVEIQ